MEGEHLISATNFSEGNLQELAEALTAVKDIVQYALRKGSALVAWQSTEREGAVVERREHNPNTCRGKLSVREGCVRAVDC